MLYYNTTCPHCGNEMTVNDLKETHKCPWCRRLVGAKFERTKGRRFRCTVEALDFPDEFDNTMQNKQKEEKPYESKYQNRNFKKTRNN